MPQAKSCARKKLDFVFHKKAEIRVHRSFALPQSDMYREELRWGDGKEKKFESSFLRK